MHIKKAAHILRAINHPLRSQLFEYLTEEKTVTEIYHHFKIEQSVASQHLAILRAAGFVTTERKGRFVYYKANHTRMDGVRALCREMVLSDFNPCPECGFDNGRHMEGCLQN